MSVHDGPEYAVNPSISGIPVLVMPGDVETSPGKAGIVVVKIPPPSPMYVILVRLTSKPVAEDST
jgi:hypothetical protein